MVEKKKPIEYLTPLAPDGWMVTEVPANSWMKYAFKLENYRREFYFNRLDDMIFFLCSKGIVKKEDQTGMFERYNPYYLTSSKHYWKSEEERARWEDIFEEYKKSIL